MTQFEVLLALANSKYSRGTWGMPKDVSYSTISVDFIREALPAWVDSLPVELTQPVNVGGGKTVRRVRWVPESGDCDNIAWDFLAFLNRCMWRDAVVSGRAHGNVAAGEFFFQVTPGDATTGHDIVWFINHEGEVHHCDPASFQIDHLNAEQMNTIFGGEYA